MEIERHVMYLFYSWQFLFFKAKYVIKKNFIKNHPWLKRNIAWDMSHGVRHVTWPYCKNLVSRVPLLPLRCSKAPAMPSEWKWDIHVSGMGYPYPWGYKSQANKSPEPQASFIHMGVLEPQTHLDWKQFLWEGC